MRKDFKEKIIHGEFAAAEKIHCSLDKKAAEDDLFNIGYDDDNICAYAYICFLLQKHESAELHLSAMSLLVIAFPFVNGGYQSGLYHVRRAIQLNPNDIDLEEMLIFMHEMPLIEKLVSDKEIREVACRVLAKKPSSTPAQGILAQPQQEVFEVPEPETLEDRIKRLIIIGEFLEAKTLFPIDYVTLELILFNLWSDEKNMSAYAFVCFLLLENETKEFHLLASKILLRDFPESDFIGKNEAAAYHIRRSQELQTY